MSIADKLGMDSPGPAQTSPEDLMEMEVSIRYSLGGRWHVISMFRNELSNLLNGGAPRIDGNQITELRLVTFEGEECNLEVSVFWDVDGTKTWRIL